MNDMKCPFCNGELVGTIGHPYCRNENCVMCDDSMPQELLELLYRTRKALETAFTVLLAVKHNYTGNIDYLKQLADEAITEIIALEQKDK